ncbi:MAG: S8 family serine peptidase, partial [Ignavibacteriaceae bacterium]|nr:S8 family serine peptidase [Ignavibacteriaceae bacterium]
MRPKLILIAIVCSFPFILLAQLSHLANKANISNKNIIIHKPGHIYSSYTTKADSTFTNDIDLTEMADYIVEFKDTPLFAKSVQGKQKLAKVSYQNTFEQFSRDIAALSHNSSAILKVSLNTPVIKREYYKVFFGVSLKASRALKDAIQSLAYVKRIYKDYTVKALDDPYNIIKKSGKRVHSDSVTGKGVIIGIIDTGIDYLHPALGGGFGTGFKVIGGYDFVNNDNDPIDDNGHGTHVAGIIAAKGDSLTGIAPDASLMAFKVLNSEGYGTESSVLAGIEQAVDPNNDGDTEDKVDIVNMSLGGSGDSNDPLSIAVDNATSIGVTFCIAAGNSGNYNTIGSPGAAVSAITVGAADESGNIAYFSSMGPDKGDYYIKPDVIAPGVNIYSTYLDSSYATLSGTSMATPYVTGVCALIKNIHPDWAPELIKSSIVNTADNTSADVMAQGGGKINKQNAEKISSLASPSNLSFGLDDAKQSTWTVQDTIEITNKNSLNQDYTISITGLQAGVSLSAASSNFTVSAGASQKIIFTLTVNNNTVAYLDNGSRAYYGNVNIAGTYDKLHLPWAFVKAPLLIVKFDVPPTNFYVVNNESLYQSYDANWTDSNCTAELIVNKGVFNILAASYVFNNGNYYVDYIIKPGIKLSGFDTISISTNEAKHLINLNGVNENGNLISTLNNGRKTYLLELPDSSYMSFTGWDIFAEDYFKMSDLPDGFSLLTMEYQSDLSTENIARFIGFDTVRNVKTDIELANKSSDLVKQNIHVSFSPHEKLHNIGIGEMFRSSYQYNGKTYYGASGSIDNPVAITANEWDGVLFSTPDKGASFGFSAFIGTNLFASEDGSAQPWFFTPPLRETADSMGLYVTPNPTPNVLFYHTNNKINFGRGVVYPYMLGVNYPSGSSTYIGLGNLLFEGQLNEERYADNALSEYSLTNESGSVIKKGTLGNFSYIKASPGIYNFEVTNNNYLIDSTIIGKAVLKDKFNLSNSDMNPPNITSLQLRDVNNIISCNMQKGDKLSLYFSILDDNISGLDSVEAYAKNYYQTGWQKLAISKICYDSLIGSYYTGDLSSFTNADTSAIDLKITAADISGNTMEYTIQPSFTVGNFKGSYTGVVKTGTTIESCELYNNYPNPFNPGTYINYNIPGDSYVKIEIFNILGQSVAKLFEGNQTRGMYKFYWNASKFASGLYFCNFTVKGKVNYQKINKLI